MAETWYCQSLKSLFGTLNQFHTPWMFCTIFFSWLIEANMLLMIEIFKPKMKKGWKYSVSCLSLHSHLYFHLVILQAVLSFVNVFLWQFGFSESPPSCRCMKRLLHTLAFLVCNNRLRFTASNSAHAIKNQHWDYWKCEFYENVSFLKYQKYKKSLLLKSSVIQVTRKPCLPWKVNFRCQIHSWVLVQWAECSSNTQPAG